MAADRSRPRRRIAVIGAGVSGLTAAYVLQRGGRRHPLRGRRPPRRARAHPRRRLGRRTGARRRHRVHRAQRPHVPASCCGCSPSSAWRPSRAEMSMSVRCDGCGLEYAGARGPGRAVRPARRRGATRATWRCWPRCRGSTARARALLAAAGDDAELTLGEFLARRPLLAVLRRSTSSCRWCRAVWSCGPGPGARVPGPLPVHVPRPPRRADASPARRPGAPSSAARAPTSSAAAKELHRGPHRDPGPGGAPHRPTASRSATTPTRSAAFDAVVVATHADQALRLLADPTAGRAARCSARSATRRNETVLHTDDVGAAPPRRAPGRPGTTCCPSCAPAPARCRSATT